MRRLFFNFAISLLTFVIGIAASGLLNLFTTAGVDNGRSCVKAAMDIPKPGNLPLARASGCVDVPGANPAQSSPVKAPISGGILNAKAINLPQPAYPAVAKAARQSGTVTVQVLVDEGGFVISACAVGGPPLLQAAAVQAARQARFSPTRLSGQPVKITGVLMYNFELR